MIATTNTDGCFLTLTHVFFSFLKWNQSFQQWRRRSSQRQAAGHLLGLMLMVMVTNSSCMKRWIWQSSWVGSLKMQRSNSCHWNKRKADKIAATMLTFLSAIIFLWQVKTLMAAANAILQQKKKIVWQVKKLIAAASAFARQHCNVASMTKKGELHSQKFLGWDFNFCVNSMFQKHPRHLSLSSWQQWMWIQSLSHCAIVVIVHFVHQCELWNHK